MDHGSVGNNEMNPLQERLYYGYQTLMKVIERATRPSSINNFTLLGQACMYIINRFPSFWQILYIMFLVLISYTAIGSVVELKTAAWIRAQGGNG